MPDLLFIARLLAFLAILGLTSGSALAEDCCCEKGQSAVQVAPSARSQAIFAREIVREIHSIQLGRSSSCGLDPNDDCACWRPLETPTPVSLATLIHQFEQQLTAVSEIPRVAPPKTHLKEPSPPPSPPDIPIPETTGWSHALFPVPPPGLS